jgi:ribosomal protein S18 acetylase RimI-like enzyme
MPKKDSNFARMNRQPFSENITSGISEATHADIQGLIEASNRYDSIDFPFTLDELPSSSDELPTTLLYTANQRVLGLLCLYNWSGIELYGLVHPAYRRCGIGQALFAAAKEMAQQHEQKSLLLGCYGSIASGIAFAEANQAMFDHADYEMKLDLNRVQHSATLHAELSLRQAEAAEIGQVVSIAAQGFGEPEEEMRDWLTKDVLNPHRRIFFIELQGNPIGTVRIIEGASQRADITLFCLLQPYRGRGYGKQILLSLVDLLLSEHRSPIALDVTTSNSGALALYHTCGFQEVRKDSYYKFVF